MNFALGVLTHTPLWVFVLLAYLIWQGIKAMQAAEVDNLAGAVRRRSSSFWACRGSAFLAKLVLGR